MIHAYLGRGCVLEDAAKAEWLSRIGEGRDAQPKPRPVKFFTLRRWANKTESELSRQESPSPSFG